MGFFDDQIAAHCARLLASAGQAVTYRRGQTAVALTAAAGQSAHDADDGAGIVTVQSVDWLLRAADLGALAPPQIGDRLEHQVGDEVLVYEVFGPAGKACHKFPHARRTWLRVYSHLVDTA